MRRTSTEGLFGKVALFFMFGALLSGCLQSSSPTLESCDSTGADILRVVLNNKDLKEYGQTYFQRDKKVILVWDDRPAKEEQCSNKEPDFVLRESHELGLKDRQFVVVSKIYFDETAAFVEVFLYPTGKHGAFFLRNKGEWKVTQRKLWESKK